jgi:pyruvate formate lyase activating enzyme
MRALGVGEENTTLNSPGRNDGEEELREIARYIKGVGREVPWHVTAFDPTYKMMNHPPTSVAPLRLARDIGIAEGLRYVYEGNVRDSGGENTYCHGCGAVVVERSGLWLVRNRLKDGKCPECGEKIDGVGM